MKLDHLNSKDDDGLMSIEELRAYYFIKRKLKVIRRPEIYPEINQRYRKISAAKVITF